MAAALGRERQEQRGHAFCEAAQADRLVMRSPRTSPP
jgi:hypothetical protein